MRRNSILFIGISFLLISYASKCYAQSFDYKENSVYVFNFIKYTTWPNKKQVIHIGIIGTTQIEKELQNLIAKKKNSLVDYSITNIDINQAKDMDVIIVAESASGKLKAIDKSTERLPILIITEKENLSRSGACISFFIDEENSYKTEYQLSLRNCKSRGLIISEQIQNNSILIR